MSGNLGDLQQRAVDLAKSNNFGAEALDVNLEIARVDAANQEIGRASCRERVSFLV